MISMRRHARLAAVVIAMALLAPVPASAEVTAPAFSTTRAMTHIKRLVANGPRKAGMSAERKAGDYVIAQLKSYGYTVRTQSVKIPFSRTSRNIIAELPGSGDRIVVVGAHLDSKVPAPGGNDNASGVAVMLEEARVLAKTTPDATIRFIAFGAEERCGTKPTQHHYGSRAYVKSLTAEELSRVSAMLSIDMVGYGSTFNVRTLKRGPMTLVSSLKAWGKTHGETLKYLKDEGADGWSDHEAFEMKGVPVAWLEWRYDPKCHTKGDTYKHVSSKKIGRTGRFVRSYLLSLDNAKLSGIRP